MGEKSLPAIPDILGFGHEGDRVDFISTASFGFDDRYLGHDTSARIARRRIVPAHKGNATACVRDRRGPGPAPYRAGVLPPVAQRRSTEPPEEIVRIAVQVDNSTILKPFAVLPKRLSEYLLEAGITNRPAYRCRYKSCSPPRCSRQSPS